MAGTGSAGSLVVSLGLNAAEYFQGLTKAEYQTRQAIGQISRQFQGLTSGIRDLGALVGVGFGVSEIVSWAKEVNSAAESLSNLSVQTGSSVENLSRLANIVNISGKSYETYETQLNRLAAGLSGAEELSTKTAAALQFLGIQSKDPATALQEIADKLNQFADGTGKAAIARDLFGRQGVAFLSTLKDIAEATDITATKTAAQARQAEDLAKIFRQLSIESHSLADAFLNDVAPALEKIGQLLVAATRETGSFFKGLGQAAGIDPFGNISKQITEVQEKLAKAKETANKPDVTYQFRIGPSDEEYIKQYEQRLNILRNIQAAQAKVNDPSNFDHFDRAAAQKPLLSYPGKVAANAVADDPTKKILDGQIKALEDNIAREKDLLRTREEFIAVSFNQGYLSIKDSFDRTQEARDEALRNTLGFYDQEIALQRAFIAKSTTSEVNRADAANKIAEYQAKQAKAIGDSIVDTQRQAIARTIADDQYLAQLDELNAKIQELAGNTERAASIRFGTSQNTPFFRSLTPEARDQFNAIGQQEIAQKALNDKNTEFRLILDAVGTAQEKINLLQQTGAISEIDALVKTSAAARQQIEVLTDLADKAEIAAQALTGIAKLEAIANVERLRLEIAKLGSQTDLLGDKFQNIFKTSFVDNLTAAIAGTKSWADAFKDAEKQIVESISRIAAQNIGDALFGKEGPLGGLGSMFGQIFGGTIGGDKGAGAAAANAALGTLSLTSATVTTSFATVATSAAAAAAALSTVAATSGSSSAGGLAGLFSGIFGGGGGGYGQFDAVSGYAKGTDFHPGGLAWVGEGGKELLNLPRGTQVIPQDKLRGMGRPNLSIVVNVPQGTSGPSADQIGVRVGAHVQRALNRNS